MLSFTSQRNYVCLTVFVAISILCSNRQSFAQDYAKTLMEQRVTLNDEQVTIIARHLYYETVKMTTEAGRELSSPASLVEVDVVHADGSRIPVWRMPHLAPYEVHRKYRLMYPTPATLDIAVWRRADGEALLICPYSTKIDVYVIDPESPLKQIPNPPILKQHTYAGPWEPMSLDELVGAGPRREKTLLVKVQPPLEMVRAVAKKRQGSRSAADMLRAEAMRKPEGRIRIIARGRSIKILSQGVASIYNTDSKDLAYRPLTEDERQLVVDAPAKYKQIPPEDVKRIWKEMSAPHSHEKP